MGESGNWLEIECVGRGQPCQSVVLARCAAEMGREGRGVGQEEGSGELRKCGTQLRWPGSPAPTSQTQEAWAPDVSAGRGVERRRELSTDSGCHPGGLA